MHAADAEMYYEEGELEEEGEPAVRVVASSLFRAAVVIDHAADFIQETNGLSKSTTEEVKFRALGAIVGLSAALLVLVVCAIFVACHIIRRRGKGYSQASLDDEKYHPDEELDDNDDGEHFKTPVERKVHELLVARLKGQLDDAIGGSLQKTGDDVEGIRSRPKTKQGGSQRAHDDVVIGALPWGRIQISENDDGLPNKAIRPAEEDMIEALSFEGGPYSQYTQRVEMMSIGTEVVLHRLEEMKALNGKVGIVRKYDKGSKRFFVEIPSGERLVVKAENIMQNDIDDTASSIALSMPPGRPYAYAAGPLPPIRPPKDDDSLLKKSIADAAKYFASPDEPENGHFSMAQEHADDLEFPLSTELSETRAKACSAREAKDDSQSSDEEGVATKHKAKSKVLLAELYDEDDWSRPRDDDPEIDDANTRGDEHESGSSDGGNDEGASDENEEDTDFDTEDDAWSDAGLQSTNDHISIKMDT